MAKRMRGAARGRVIAPASGAQISSGASLFGSSAGRWATSQFKAAALAGRALNAAVLRTADTLRENEWRHFDTAVVEAAKIRLVGVGDLLARGLVRPVPNALGKMVFAYEKVTDMDEASVSLDGLTVQTDNDRQEFDLHQLPLPITHKDFFINLRQLAASRESGEPLDTMGIRQAGRVVAETLEKMLFQGLAKKFGGLSIYGYTTFPDRIEDTFDSGKDWGDQDKTGASYLKDVQNMIAQANAARQYGPFGIYVPTDAGVAMAGDYNAGTANAQTIIGRLLQVPGIEFIKVADQLPTGNVVMVQMDVNTAAWAEGETIQTVQWDEYGGMRLNFKAMAIGVPLLRSDIEGRCGIVHLHD